MQPILITGATGLLGQVFVKIAAARGLPLQPMKRSDLDVSDAHAVSAALERSRPWAVVNAAGYARVNEAERDQDRCWRDNSEGAAVLAEACARRGVELLTFSSHLVFDGVKGERYEERDRPAPLSVYGRAKAEAEARVLVRNPRALVVRTSALFGPWDDRNFVTRALAHLAAGQTFAAADDVVVSPTYAPDLAQVSLDLLIDRASGVWHLASEGAVTWSELARSAARTAGLGEDGVEGRAAACLGLGAPRPAYSALGSERGALLPPLEDALRRYAHERAAHLRQEQEDSR